jgi:hypothetical protein
MASRKRCSTCSAGGTEDESKHDSSMFNTGTIPRSYSFHKELIDTSKKSKSCNIILVNYSNATLTGPKTYMYSGMYIGGAKPTIPPQSQHCVQFAKKDYFPLGCSGLLSYTLDGKRRFVIMFRVPLIQFFSKDGNRTALWVTEADANKFKDETLYTNMAYKWVESNQANFRGLRASAGHGIDLKVDGDFTFKFTMSQGGNAEINMEIHGVQ